ncbi:hypothetical protein N7519_007314 [Penicillium mononematosum]|uniref:uncharacterized protein n=1 Tax=Penicillium mononematosum TaxID=268346 RepID=UPI002549BFF9|nr:uncharacterized protein N7519_007314 [Penicillium mononematosum]KAJ6186013.1 hypothetical protein N7519_007314 [Penicillium mononematosum]
MQLEPGRPGEPSPGMSIEEISLKTVDLQTCPGGPVRHDDKDTRITVASYVADLEMALHAHGTYVEVSIEAPFSSLSTRMEVVGTSASRKLVLLQNLLQDMVRRSACQQI